MKPEKRFAVVIHPDTTIEIVETAGGVDEIHRLVGGHFENVYSTNFHVFPIVVSVNDIGKLIGLAFNPLGTLLHNNPYDFLVGHVVILKLERVGEFDELISFQ